MSRAIKFRAWSESLGMSRPTSLHEIDGSDFHEFEHFMQFTGLTDRNGVEIYEGDILRETVGVFGEDLGENGYIEAVRWGGRGWTTLRAGEQPRPYAGHAPFMDWSTCAVVGNIHENPELLQ